MLDFNKYTKELKKVGKQKVTGGEDKEALQEEKMG